MGMPFQCVVSSRIKLAAARAASGRLISSSRVEVTSGGGTFPLTSPSACAAGRPEMNAPSPPAFVAAM